MKNKRKMAIASIVLSVVSLPPFVIAPEKIEVAQLFIVICVLIAIVGAILGYISKKDGKGLSIAGIVVGIISCILLIISLIGFLLFSKVSDCVDNGDDTATCQYAGQTVNVPINYLTDEQMKREEE